MRRLSLLFGACFLCLLCRQTLAGELQDIRSRGYLACGVRGVVGLGSDNAAGEFSGFEVDICRALAISVFGDAAKTKFIKINVKERFNDLKNGKYDVLLGMTTINFNRSVIDGISPAVNVFYDTQLVLAKKNLKIDSLDELTDSSKRIAVCFVEGNNAKDNFDHYLLSRNLKIDYVKSFYEQQAFLSDKKVASSCDMIVNDGLLLMTYKATNPYITDEDYSYLSDVISMDALAMFVRSDEEMVRLTRMTFNIMLIAEQMGITSKNIDSRLTADIGNHEVLSLYGKDRISPLLLKMGMTNGFAYNIIKNIGNYAEIYNRNIGDKTSFKVPRKYNHLIKNGGVMYSPSVGVLPE